MEVDEKQNLDIYLKTNFTVKKPKLLIFLPIKQRRKFIDKVSALPLN